MDGVAVDPLVISELLFLVQLHQLAGSIENLVDFVLRVQGFQLLKKAGLLLLDFCGARHQLLESLPSEILSQPALLDDQRLVFQRLKIGLDGASELGSWLICGLLVRRDNGILLT